MCVCVCVLCESRHLTCTRLQFTFHGEEEGRVSCERILEIVKMTVYLQQCAVLFVQNVGHAQEEDDIYSNESIRKLPDGLVPPPFLASACIFTLTPIETTPPVNKFVATTDFFRPVPNLPPNPLYIPHNVSLSLLSFRFILDYTVRSRKKLRVFSNNNSIFS